MPATPTPNWINVTPAADNTGVNDAAPAIQAAIDAASAPNATSRVVYLPSGRYRVDWQPGKAYALRVIASDVTLLGDGPSTTIELNVPTADASAVTSAILMGGFGNPTNPFRNAVRNLRLKQTGAPFNTIGQDVSMIAIQNVNDMIIQDVDIIVPFGSGGGLSGVARAVGVGIYYYSNAIACKRVRVMTSGDFPDPNAPGPALLTGFRVKANVTGSSLFNLDECGAAANLGFDLCDGESIYLRNCAGYVKLHPGFVGPPINRIEHVQFWGVENLVGDGPGPYIEVTTEHPQSYVKMGQIRGGMLIHGVGIILDPGTGSILGLQIEGATMSGGGQGAPWILLKNPSAGVMDKVSIQNCHITDAVAPQSGISVQDNVSGWVVQGCTIGNGVDGTAGTRYGVSVAGPLSDRFVIEGNVLRDNVLGPIDDHSTGTNNRKQSNLLPAAVLETALATQLDDTAIGNSKGRIRAPFKFLAIEMNATFGADGNYLLTSQAQFQVKKGVSQLQPTLTVPQGSSFASVALNPPVLISQNDEITFDHTAGANEGGAIQVQLRGRQVDA